MWGDGEEAHWEVTVDVDLELTGLQARTVQTARLAGDPDPATNGVRSSRAAFR
jgi:hypothetical protein